MLGTLLGLLGIELKSTDSSLLSLAPGLAELLRALPGSLLLAPSTPQARLDGSFLIR